MRYELSDYEWTAIKPMLPNKPRGVRRVTDRRVLNGIFLVLCSRAPWRDLPENYGPIHDLLQSLRALATGWHLGPDHGSHGRRPRWRGTDDRYLRCVDRVAEGSSFRAASRGLDERITPPEYATPTARQQRLDPPSLHIAQSSHFLIRPRSYR